MTQTVFLLFGICLSFGIFELLLPDTAGEGTRRLLRFLLSLTVILVISAPFFSFLQKDVPLLVIQPEEGELQEYQRIFEDALQTQSEADLKSGLLLLLEREYGIAAKDCSLLVSFGADGSLQHISIYLKGAALTKDPLEIEAELAQRLGCAVEVR